MVSSKTAQIPSSRFAILSEVVLLIAGSSDLEKLFADLVSKIKWVIDFDLCLLALADEDGKSYRLRTLLDLRGAAVPAPDKALQVCHGIAGTVIQSRQVRMIADLAALQDDLPALTGKAGSILAVPLVAYNRVLGALLFASDGTNAYSREDIKVAVSIAAHLALAIDRALQVEQLQRANRELERLASFPELNPGPVIEFDSAGLIHYLNPAAKAFCANDAWAVHQYPLMEGLPDLLSTLQEKADGVLVREVQWGGRWYQQTLQRIPESTTVRCYGTDITERKQAEESLQKQHEYLAALHDTTFGLISRLDLHELLQAIVSRAAQLLRTAHGFVFLCDDRREELEQKVGIGAFLQTVGSRIKRGEGISGYVVETGEPLLVPDYQAWDNRARAFDGMLLKTSLAVPLKSHNRAVGAIGLGFEPEYAYSIGETEIALVSRFAELASLALDNARLFAET